MCTIGEKLVKARPHLMRLASLRGVTPDALDDVVQETLLEAWQTLDRLHSLKRLDVWLDGICRNICRRWHQRHQRFQARHVALTEMGEDESVLYLTDQTELDPAEEFSRQDLEVLLDRALGHLSAENRQAIELCYLHKLPQRETAMRLSMTISALEARLHRARRQLQQILSGVLRADAEALGLAIGGLASGDWREAREWCASCGRQHLSGLFQPQEDGTVQLLMRCPTCSPQQKSLALIGYLPAGSWHSFRPAIKRVAQTAYDYVVKRYHEDHQGRCVRCGAENPLYVMDTWAYSKRFLSSEGAGDADALLHFVLSCRACSYFFTGIVGSHMLFHPQVQHFRERYPRAIFRQHTQREYAGAPAIPVSLADPLSSAHLTVFLHCETIQVLAIREE